MSKLSKSQLELLKLMADGWELGKDATGSSGWWMQKGGLGRGGEAKNVHLTTAHNSYKKGLIKRDDTKPHFPSTHYCLTEKGKKAVEEDKKHAKLTT